MSLPEAPHDLAQFGAAPPSHTVFTVLCAGQHACSELPPTDTDDPVQHAVQLSFPTAFLYEPAAQGKHSRFSSGLKKKKCPAMQLHSKTVALPGTETAFAGQALHAVLALAEYVSAGQSVHTVEAVALLYLPPAHAAQVLMSACSMFPGAHWHVPGSVSP